MTAFWIIGIGINVVMLAALAWWAVRNWPRGDAPPKRRPPGDGG